jgi:hypothetical protein
MLKASGATEGASIRCATCGRRPFASSWGLPPQLECFDLIKVGGVWGCPQHRAVAVETPCVNEPKSKDEIDTLLITISHMVDALDVAEADEQARDAILNLIDKFRIERAVKSEGPEA